MEYSAYMHANQVRQTTYYKDRKTGFRKRACVVFMAGGKNGAALQSRLSDDDALPQCRERIWRC